MRIRLNGKDHDLDRALTVAELLERLELGTEPVAVAVNHEVVPRGRRVDRRLAEGDEVEIIRAVAGG